MNDIASVMKVADIFVMPSLKEGMPMALLEAMACGVTVVATMVGEIPFIVKDDYSGLLLNEPDPEEIVDKIEYVLTNEDRAVFYQSNAKREILKSYTLETMSLNYINIYSKVLNKMLL